MWICGSSIARMVVTTVTVAHLSNALPPIGRFIAAALSTYEQIQATLSDKYLYSGASVLI